MKTFASSLLLALLIPNASSGQVGDFDGGLSVGPDSSTGIWPRDLTPPVVRHGFDLNAPGGHIGIASGTGGVNRGTYDGGVTLWGNPIDIVLATEDATDKNQGVFRIWKRADYQGVSAESIFKVSSTDNTATFNGLNVSISGGTLKVEESPVVTQGTLSTYLEGLSGKIDIGNGTASHSGAVAIGQNSPLASKDGAVALGGGQATGLYSLASGQNAQATGDQSVALGLNSIAAQAGAVAMGWSYAGAPLSFATSQGYASANGVGATAVSGGTADGVNTFAAGNGTYARAFNSVSLGGFPLLPGAGENRSGWYALDPVFTVGNGWWSADHSARSNAIRTLKNGSTTLTNKAWKAAVSANPTNPGVALEDPADTSDSEGRALTVEGHTSLKGKVTIEKAQGDISMGIFQ